MFCSSYRRILLNAVTVLATFLSPTCAQVFDCEPCIDRSKYSIKAIVHGTKSSRFWQRVKKSAVQASKDMNIDLQMELYDTFDSQKMADDIISVYKSKNPPSALVVSIPSGDVASAVKFAIDAGVPVFGLNSGTDIATDLGVLGFVGMDEYLGGVEAANAMLKASPDITNALYINIEKGNLALDQRRDGFSNRLTEVNEMTQVEELILSGSNETEKSSQINEKLDGCTYDAILLSSSSVLQSTISTSALNGCRGTTMIGTFDTNSEVFLDIAFGRAVFGISQQEYLQGALPVIMASIFATTGKRLSLSAESKDGIYMSGPKVVDRDNHPSDTQLACTAAAFPVCPDTQGVDGLNSECPCTDRSLITIGGVLHGVTTDTFWDPVFAAAEQAGRDMGINMQVDRLEPEDDHSVLYSKMSSKIESLCKDGVDGIFVSIPNEEVVDSIKLCQQLDVPVVSVNSGVEISKSLGLMHHIGQLGYNAGIMAGLRLVELAPEINRAFCLNHFPGVTALLERCDGFEEAISSLPGVSYGGMVEIPQDNSTLYKTIVEEAVGETGDWVGIGMLLLGESAFNSTLELKAAHPGVKMGTFDLFAELYGALEEGTMEFGIDQNPFLQGYFPVSLLTYMAYTGQKVVNQVIETGPGFVESPESGAEQICEANFYEVCSSSAPSSTDVPMPAPTKSSVPTPPPASSSAMRHIPARFLVVFGALVFITSVHRA